MFVWETQMKSVKSGQLENGKPFKQNCAPAAGGKSSLYLVSQTKLSARRRRKNLFFTLFPKQIFPPAAGENSYITWIPKQNCPPAAGGKYVFTWFPKQNFPPAAGGNIKIRRRGRKNRKVVN